MKTPAQLNAQIAQRLTEAEPYNDGERKTVNAAGLKEIHAFLAENHKLGGDHFTPSMLRAWANDAESQLDEGNPATIELKSWDSVHGHTKEFTISEAGLDSEIVEIDE